MLVICPPGYDAGGLISSAGIVPIPGAKSVAQAKDTLGALDWTLDDNEVAMINEKIAAVNK